MRTLSFEPLIPAAVWVTLGVLGLALLVWYAARRPTALSRRRWAGVVALMGVALAAVLVLLLNPTWVQELPPPAGKPVLTVLVDASASMATADADDGQTRYAEASKLAQGLTRELSARYDVRVRTFAAAAQPADPADLTAHASDGPLTDIATAVSSSLEESHAQGQAVVLLSDGIHNAPGGVSPVLAAAALAKAWAVPVYTKTLGGAADVRDVSVELARPQDVAFVGQRVPITVTLRQRGLAGGLANVVLRVGDRELDRRTATLSPDAAAEVRFDVSQEQPGVYAYDVRVEPYPGEVTLANNSAAYLLRVVDQPVRVLLLEGKPYWDTKFLMRRLASDPAVELTSVVRMTPKRLLEQTWEVADAGDPNGHAAPGLRAQLWSVMDDPAALLASRDTLAGYQVLVLGRDVEVFLTDAALANVRNWLARDGGALVCYRGSPTAQVNQTLGRLLPVAWEPTRETRFHVQLTQRGSEMRWLPGGAADTADVALAQLPTLATSARPVNPKPLAIVLAKSAGEPAEADRPVVTYQPYGNGRVVVVEGAGMWRWAFLPPQHAEYDAVYSSLWQSLLRWLVSNAGLLPGQNVAMRSERVSFSVTEPAAATLLLREELTRGELPKIELRGGTLSSPQVFAPTPVGDEPGLFRVVFGKLPEGRYEAHVVVGSASSGSGADPNRPTDPNAAAAAPLSTIAFDVRSYVEEQLDLKARPDLMARAAADSGGAVLSTGTAREVAEQFRAHLARNQPPLVTRTTAWDRWWWLTLILVGWTAAWAARRMSGLV